MISSTIPKYSSHVTEKVCFFFFLWLKLVSPTFSVDIKFHFVGTESELDFYSFVILQMVSPYRVR